MRVIAFDIGGSSVKRALIEVNRGKAQIYQRMEPVQPLVKSLDDLRPIILQGIRESIFEDSEIAAVGISTTGSVTHKGVVLRAGHFAGYENVDWRNEIGSAGLPIDHVTVANDGQCSALAEYAELDKLPEIFCHIVIGTGIGGAILVDGQVLHGSHNAAGNIGHTKVSTTSKVVCSCTRFGCVETFAAVPAIIRARSSVTENENEDIRLDQIVREAREGNIASTKILRDAGHWLGVALANVLNTLDPGTITLGGGLIDATVKGSDDWGTYVDSAVRMAQSLALRRIASEPTIRVGSHGNDAGLLGAALLAAASSV